MTHPIEEAGYFAQVHWTAEDLIANHRPSWTARQAGDWLNRHQDEISEAMRAAGDEVIAMLLLEESVRKEA